MVKDRRGFLLIVFMIAVAVLTVFVMKGTELWEAVVQRELEQELLFRARQYVRAIAAYAQKNSNVYPESVEILVLEKYLRREYREPLGDSGTWRFVLRDRLNENKLFVVAGSDLKAALGRAYWVGVAPTASGKSYFVYKGREYYEQWLFFVGDESLTQVPQAENL